MFVSIRFSSLLGTMLLTQDTVAVETRNAVSTADSKPSIAIESLTESDPLQRSMTLANVARTKDDKEKPELKVEDDCQKEKYEQVKSKVGSLGDSNGICWCNLHFSSSDEIFEYFLLRTELG